MIDIYCNIDTTFFTSITTTQHERTTTIATSRQSAILTSINCITVMYLCLNLKICSGMNEHYVNLKNNFIFCCLFYFLNFKQNSVYIYFFKFCFFRSFLLLSLFQHIYSSENNVYFAKKKIKCNQELFSQTAEFRFPGFKDRSTTYIRQTIFLLESYQIQSCIYSYMFLMHNN